MSTSSAGKRPKAKLSAVIKSVTALAVVLAVWTVVARYASLAARTDAAVSLLGASLPTSPVRFCGNATGVHPCACADLRVSSYPLRPRLMLVVSETPDRKERPETQHVVDNFKKWCARHGYLFKYHVLAVEERLGVCGTRWLQLLDYWHMADWLLHIDSDTLVANLTNSVDAFLESPEHVLLHLRPNREVTAAAVAFRTSEFSRCFINRWLAILEAQLLQGASVNADNGALLLLLAELLDPALAKACTAHRDVFDLISCFEKLHPRLARAHTALPIRVFMPFSGFWRQHEGVDPPGADSCSTKVYYRCWSSDVLVSGWKSMGENMWPDLQANPDTAKCTFNTPEEQLQLAKACCFTGYPGCVVGGTNVCRQQPACQDPGAGVAMKVRADVGYGICKLVEFDNTWSHPKGLPESTNCLLRPPDDV